MSDALSEERVKALGVLADAVDARLATAEGNLKAAAHDQRSLRTAILALQHELETEIGTKGGPAR